MKDIIFDPPEKFDFKCAEYVPFRDREIAGSGPGGRSQWFIRGWFDKCGV